MNDERKSLVEQALAQVPTREARIEVVPGELEASISGTVASKRRWLDGTTVTAFVRQQWDGAKARLWGVRASKKF